MHDGVTEFRSLEAFSPPRSRSQVWKMERWFPEFRLLTTAEEGVEGRWRAALALLRSRRGVLALLLGRTKLSSCCLLCASSLLRSACFDAAQGLASWEAGGRCGRRPLCHDFGPWGVCLESHASLVVSSRRSPCPRAASRLSSSDARRPAHSSTAELRPIWHATRSV